MIVDKYLYNFTAYKVNNRLGIALVYQENYDTDTANYTNSVTIGKDYNIDQLYQTWIFDTDTGKYNYYEIGVAGNNLNFSTGEYWQTDADYFYNIIQTALSL